MYRLLVRGRIGVLLILLWFISMTNLYNTFLYKKFVSSLQVLSKFCVYVRVGTTPVDGRLSV